MADVPVIFMQLTQSQYNGITPKDRGTLYFCTDTQKIYLGSELYGGKDIAKLTIKNGTNTIEYDGSSAKSIEIPSVTVDTTLSSTSTNPVQNKAVKSAIDTISRGSLPTWTTSDNGKFLKVVRGTPTWVGLTNVAEEGA